MMKVNFWKARVNESASLNRVDRISEVLFGLIMVLTFTGAISIATDNREDVRELLIAALGCNIAWGLVDAIMYLMNVYAERGNTLRAINRIQKSKNTTEKRKLIREQTSVVLNSLMQDEEIDRLSQKITALPEPELKNIFSFKDLIAGMEIFLLVFLCTFPVVVPFLFIDEIGKALRLSNLIALIMLFIGGYLLGSYAGFRKIITALIYTGIGVFLVAFTMALGG